MTESSHPVSRRERRETEQRAASVESAEGTTEALPTADSAAVEAEADGAGLSRRERRRLERLENPVETWTAEEEMRHTGRTPAMTPERIVEQEQIAREKAASAQEDAKLATGEMGGMVTERSPVGGDDAGYVPAQPEAQAPVAPKRPTAKERAAMFPPGSLQHKALAAEAEIEEQQAAQAASGGEVAGIAAAALDAVNAAATGGNRYEAEAAFMADGGQQAPVGVPALSEVTPAFGSPMQEPPGVPGAPPAPPDGVAPPGAPQPKPATVPVAQVAASPFAPGGSAPQLATPGTLSAQGGQSTGAMVPGAGAPGAVSPPAFNSGPATGGMRAVGAPGTGAIPRPVVEVHPAGGASHFGWPQIVILAAAAFVLGLIVWNVAGGGG